MHNDIIINKIIKLNLFSKNPNFQNETEKNKIITITHIQKPKND